VPMFYTFIARKEIAHDEDEIPQAAPTTAH